MKVGQEPPRVKRRGALYASKLLSELGPDRISDLPTTTSQAGATEFLVEIGAKQ